MRNTLKIFLFIPLLISSISAQELDQDFLDSLPDDIQSDIKNKNNNQSDSLQPNYGPYSQSSKLSYQEDVLVLKNRIEQDLLQLEERLNSEETLKVSDDLKLFGLEFFNSFQTTYMPINEPNPDSGYILDIGDVLEIQLVGQNNYIDNFSIKRDGSISLPDIAKINVAGLSINMASKLIQSKVNSAFIGTEASISLKEIRDINVVVSGNARNPGIYTLTGNSNLLHALSVAGGVSDQGSLREINLIRGDQIIETLDVYDLLINGQYNLKSRLRSGDVVFVQARKNIVTVDGAVKRPAKFEVINGQMLDSVIEYANGLKNTADLRNLSVSRLSNGSQEIIPVETESQFESIMAADGDLVYIRDYPYRNAKITGAVVKPGTYTMAAGETIKDLVQKAGGYTENAYIFGSVYQTEEAKIISEKSKEVLYEDFLDNIITISQQSLGQPFDVGPIVSLARDIKRSKSNGRVVVDMLDESLMELYSIQKGDELYIPEINNVVYIFGETSNKGAMIYTPNQGVDYYVNKIGGYKTTADKQSIYVLHPNGESELYTKTKSIFQSSPNSAVNIYPGSIIFVPRTMDNSVPKRLAAQANVSILSSLALTVASLSSLGD